MKLAILAFAGLLGLGSLAHADPAPAPPPGNMRGALLARFDHNHDGRLEPRERRQAIRALRKLTRKLARQQMRARRQLRAERGVIQRYDLDGDGDVGPAEMPPAAANRLRRLDRNHDGWIDDADQ